MSRLLRGGWILLVLANLAGAGCTGGGQPSVDVKALLTKPKTYVGSEQCKVCHLEHYDSWKGTLHGRMLQDVRENKDAIVTDLDPKIIQADLAKLGDKLKVPADKVYIPKVEEVRYTIGNQWKQRYLVEKDKNLYIAPIQYNLDTGRWVPYNEDKWDKRSWIKLCGYCHATGVDIEKNVFTEPGIGCEACHGPGSHHVALPKSAVFDKRLTIVNPSKLPSGIAVQICGSCHNRGSSTRMEGSETPVGYLPGKALEHYFRSVDFATMPGDFYPNNFSKGHHQQYIDWRKSKHATEGVNCTSCHYVHQLGVPSNRSQTKGAGSQQCLTCHQVINNNLAHSIHSFGNCVGCHMPRITQSAESGDLHSHVFVTLLPKETLADKRIPNSCQTCHRHKNEDLAQLQAKFDALAVLPKPTGPVMESLKNVKK